MTKVAFSKVENIPIKKWQMQWEKGCQNDIHYPSETNGVGMTYSTPGRQMVLEWRMIPYTIVGRQEHPISLGRWASNFKKMNIGRHLHVLRRGASNQWVSCELAPGLHISAHLGWWQRRCGLSKKQRRIEKRIRQYFNKKSKTVNWLEKWDVDNYNYWDVL